MKRIPRGNTADQVNETAYKMLFPLMAKVRKLLDLPCGEGEWICFLKQSFPAIQMVGVDIRKDVSLPGIEIHSLDVTREPLPGKDYDLITSISGIVCFGNHLKFFRDVFEGLSPQGRFLITHDNHWTVRDRLSFLFFGTFKRFPLLYRENEGNTQVTSQMTVLNSLERAGFVAEKIEYTSIRFEDLLWIPFAILLWLFQWPKIYLTKSKYSAQQKQMIFPFKALYARHFLILALKSKKT